MTTYPCLMCAKKLAQAGIVRIVFDRDYNMPITKEFLANFDHITVEQFALP